MAITRKKKAAKAARKFEPGVFTGAVLETTDHSIYVATEVGPLRIPRKPGPTRYAKGDEVEFQIGITARAADAQKPTLTRV